MWDAFVWWLVLGWFPTSTGAVLTVLALRRGYGYRGRHAQRGRGLTLALVPERVDSSERVWQVRERIDARAALAEVERVEIVEHSGAGLDDETRDWLAGLQSPVDLHPQLHRYEHAAGSLAYVAAPRDARVSTQEMVLRFGEELGPVLQGVVEDEWVEVSA